MVGLLGGGHGQNLITSQFHVVDFLCVLLNLGYQRIVGIFASNITTITLHDFSQFEPPFCLID